MADTKKYLDLTGLQKYDELIKGVITAGDTANADDISAINTSLESYKVKDVTNAEGAIVTLSVDADGKVSASTNANVVVDGDYSTVKTNANNSAAAWNKFLEGSTGAYPDGITPTLAELATKTDVSDGDTATLNAAKAYADSLAGNYDAAGSAAQALTDAKAYADGLAVNYDAAGSAAAVKSELTGTLSETDAATLEAINDRIDTINTAIAGGVNFVGVFKTLPEAAEYGNGNVIIVGNKEYILVDNSGSKSWVELGDTTAETERISALEVKVGSAATGTTGATGLYAYADQAEADAKAYADSLAGNYDAAGSAAQALTDAKAYVDTEIAKFTAISDAEIEALFN